MLTDEQREALCICDFAHDTRDAADNAALKDGCERFQAQAVAIVSEALAARETELWEQIAGEMRTEIDDPASRLSGHSGLSVRWARGLAARIARGDQ